LNVQHRAFHFIQGSKNYLAPVDATLKAVGNDDMRILDIGCGESALVRQDTITDSRFWNMVRKSPWEANTDVFRSFEMAKEFPHVQHIVSLRQSTI
jgi:hypothetical protein